LIDATRIGTGQKNKKKNSFYAQSQGAPHRESAGKSGGAFDTTDEKAKDVPNIEKEVGSSIVTYEIKSKIGRTELRKPVDEKNITIAGKRNRAWPIL